MSFSYSVAPMLDLTDSGFRRLIRLLNENVVLYTEMVVDQSLIHGDEKRFLTYNPIEHPLALQLAGCSPELLSKATRKAVPYRFDEINLNAGCPSARVQAGTFGAVLMNDPLRVSDCLCAMNEASGDIPVSIKTRLGFPGWTYDDFLTFVSTVYERSGVSKWIIHARYANLSLRRTKDNIQKQDLHYDLVYRLKKDMPHLTVILNGSIHSLGEGEAHKPFVDGVMVGRAAYVDPMLFNPQKNRIDVLLEALKLDLPRRHLMGLFHGQVNARLIRSFLADKALSNEDVIIRVKSL